MAKVKNSASKSKKKPIEQYAHKGKQRANEQSARWFGHANQPPSSLLVLKPIA
jgi:hypothetical protein